MDPKQPLNQFQSNIPPPTPPPEPVNDASSRKKITLIIVGIFSAILVVIFALIAINYFTRGNSGTESNNNLQETLPGGVPIEGRFNTPNSGSSGLTPSSPDADTPATVSESSSPSSETSELLPTSRLEHGGKIMFTTNGDVVLGPDSKTIAYALASSGGEGANITFVVNKEKYEFVGESGRDQWLPTFSPDSKRVAFIKNTSETMSVVVAEINGDSISWNEHRENKYVGQPRFSDDNRIVYIAIDNEVDNSQASLPAKYKVIVEDTVWAAKNIIPATVGTYWNTATTSKDGSSLLVTRKDGDREFVATETIDGNYKEGPKFNEIWAPHFDENDNVAYVAHDDVNQQDVWFVDHQEVQRDEEYSRTYTYQYEEEDYQWEHNGTTYTYPYHGGRTISASNGQDVSLENITSGIACEDGRFAIGPSGYKFSYRMDNCGSFSGAPSKYWIAVHDLNGAVEESNKFGWVSSPYFSADGNYVGFASMSSIAGGSISWNRLPSP